MVRQGREGVGEGFGEDVKECGDLPPIASGGGRHDGLTSC